MDEHDRAEPGTVRIDDPWRETPAPRLWGPQAPAGDPVLAWSPPWDRPDPARGSEGGAAWDPAWDPAPGPPPDPAGTRDPAPWTYGARVPGWGDALASAPGTLPEAYGRAAVYLDAQRGAEFQRMRRSHRRFVVPACLLFLGSHLLLVLTAVAAPGVLGSRLLGPVNLAVLAALAQFAVPLLLACLYERSSRLRRDRAALDLRWEIQERTR